MKYKTAAFILFLLPNFAYSEDSAYEQTLLSRYQPYATYFGFSDVKQYLRFANQLEMLIAGSLVLGPPISEDPAYLALKNMPLSSASAAQKKQLEDMVQARRNRMADTLGVPEPDMDEKVNSYLDYRKLAMALEKLKHPTSAESQSGTRDATVTR